MSEKAFETVNGQIASDKGPSVNLTQRGEIGLTMAGAVASALRYLLKGILKGDDKVRQIYLTLENQLGNIEKQIVDARRLSTLFRV